MPRKSRIQTDLSAEDLEAFNRLLAGGRLTIDDLQDWLEARGYDISRSAVGRHVKSYSQVAERLRQSREVVEALARELPDAATQGKQGRLLVEMTRGLAFDLLERMQAEGDAAPKDIQALGKAFAELGRAARLDQDFEEKVAKLKEQTRREYEAELKRKIEEAAGKGGFDAAAAEEARRILGFA
ncbi:phage protein Gp27 family protein [Pararhodospirillum photometricum]|nr:phage protein Gp27 family protein [Pararhodospirillum photometricum]